MNKLSVDQIQERLFRLAGLFVGLNALALALAPGARLPAPSMREWVMAALPYGLCLAVWLAGFALLGPAAARRLPQRDPYLLPLAAVLSGWGILIITRLSPTLGIRQAAWLGISLGVVTLGLRLPADLRFLQRFKYIWLTSGLLLTALTLFLGTNPLGYGPRLWLGWGGFYLQPSEPLKLLLVIYLAAYLADQPFLPLLAARKEAPPQRLADRLMLPLLAPTIVMTGLALLLMLAQRDLGTASIFIFLFTVVVYLASGRRLFLVTSLVTMAAAGVAAYRLFDVVRLRMDAWLNPWLDPSGRSYQIVQSLLAVANGGVLGRGPGMGSPSLVPVAHSDFIFAALAEEYGLAGTLALLGLFGLLALRGLSIAVQAPGPYRRLLAGGLSAYLAGQAILIIGGNIRLLPLTGVTLPFVSYGGSSLIVSFIGLVLLLKISAAPPRGMHLADPRPYQALAGVLLAGLAAAALVTGWWAVYRAPELLTRTDNARRAIADRSVRRGALLDRHQEPLVVSEGQPGELERISLHPALSPILGYTHPVYGQSGLEASLDPALRGTQGNAVLLTAWDHLRTGYPPPGLDVRLSLQLPTQRVADTLLSGQRAALMLVNAESGEILVMSSHPNFDPNNLEADWESLMQAQDAPFLNRATQALYPVGTAANPLLLAAVLEMGKLPALTVKPGECTLAAANETPPSTWGAALSAGCATPAAMLSRLLGSQAVLALYQDAGLYTAVDILLPVLVDTPTLKANDPAATAFEARATPLSLALAAAAITNRGERPQPLLVLDLRLPGADWQALYHNADPQGVFAARAAQDAARSLADPLTLTWHTLGSAYPAQDGETQYTWFLGGTSAGWQGSPLALALVLEGSQAELAQEIGVELLRVAMQP